MKTRLTRRAIGVVVWPPTRILAGALLWSHRHTLALWGRSLAAEVQRRPFDGQRLAALVRTLWKVSTDARLRGVGGIESITVDTAVDPSDATQRAASVRATLLDVPGVVAVEVTGEPDSEPLTVHADGAAA